MPELGFAETIQPSQLQLKQLTPAEKVSRFLEKTHFFESKTKEGYKGVSFNEWFKNTPNEQIVRYLILFNDLTRQQSTNKKEIDGVNVAITDSRQQIEYLPPKYEDKIPFLNQTIDAIKQLHSPLDQGLLAYYAIQNIHPFNEGNGRTARLIFTLFSTDNRDEASIQNLKKLLEHQKEPDNKSYNDFFESMFMESFAGESHNKKQNTDAERENFANKVLKPEKVRSFINQELYKSFFGKDFLDHYSSVYIIKSPFTSFLNIPNRLTSSMNEDQKDRLSLIIPESGAVSAFPTNALVWLKLINNHQELSSHLIKDQSLIKINAESILASHQLTPDHLSEIIKISDEIKRKSNEILIRFFTHPDQYTHINANGQTTTIKESFLLNQKS